MIAFQTKHKSEGVLVDGVVGDQTWSFLREGAPEKPKTDGRAPYSYVEKGLEARWVRERELVVYDTGDDSLRMQAVSVGDTDQIVGRKARIRITAPSGVQKVVDRPLGAGVPQSATGEGSTHDVVVERLGPLFDPVATAAPPGSYLVEAYMDKELGGDSFSEAAVVGP